MSLRLQDLIKTAHLMRERSRLGSSEAETLLSTHLCCGTCPQRSQSACTETVSLLARLFGKKTFCPQARQLCETMAALGAIASFARGEEAGPPPAPPLPSSPSLSCSAAHRPREGPAEPPRRRA